MCHDEGLLTAYLDGEVTDPQRVEIEAHASACPECSATLARLRADHDLAACALERLQPSAAVVPLPVRGPVTAPARRVGRAQIAAAVAAALIVGSFALQPVRSAAAGLLQIFRMQNVQTVTVSQADLKAVATALKKGGHVDLKVFGDAWIDGATSKPKTVTLAQAQAAVDFPVKLPSNASGTPTLLLTGAQTYQFKFHVAAINDALASYGSATRLPSALDGKVFTVKVPAILVAQYPPPVGIAGSLVNGAPREAKGIYVGQARSPELVVPEGVDATQLRSALLSLPFIPQSVRDQLAAIQNWQSTLIIPNVDGTAHNVIVNGVAGVVVTPKSVVRDSRNLPDSTTVIWNDNGVVRAIGGPIDEATVLGLAKSTMK